MRLDLTTSELNMMIREFDLHHLFHTPKSRQPDFLSHSPFKHAFFLRYTLDNRGLRIQKSPLQTSLIHPEKIANQKTRGCE